MKHIKEFEEFVNESSSRTSNKYKTQNVEWDGIEPGDYIADGPNVGEVSKVISNTRKGFTLKRVWNNVRKKDGEEFFVPHDLDAMKDYPNSIIKVINYVEESVTNEASAFMAKDVAKTVAFLNAEVGPEPGYLFFGHNEDIEDFDKLWKKRKYQEALDMLAKDREIEAQTFDDVKPWVKESQEVNEGLQFNDSQGNPNKISKEILGYVEKAFPAKVLSAVESVEPNGYNGMSSPTSVTNKGQATGVREYQTITLLFPEGGLGKSKVSSITVGLVKRTSGPGTGYIAVSANNYQGTSSSGNHILLDKLPNWSIAKEFYDNADERLKELFDEVIAKHI